MFVTLFLALVVVSDARYLTIRVGRVTVKQRLPIVIYCLINPTLILYLVLIAVDPTLQDRWPHLLRLPLGPEPSLVPLLSVVSLTLRLLFQSSLNP